MAASSEPYLAQDSIDCEYEAINAHSNMDPRPRKLRPEVMALPHCPAVNEKGKSTGVHCDVCGRCANAKLGSKIAVHRH